MAGKKGVSPVTMRQAAKTLGKLGGKVGGPARAKVLTKGQRQAIARKGGKASGGK